MTEPDEVLFPLVGVWRMIRAFPERAVNPLWWLGLISGILRVFAGLWPMEGVTEIARAIAVRGLHEELVGAPRSCRGEATGARP
jgi:hypothetical protein